MIYLHTSFPLPHFFNVTINVSILFRFLVFNSDQSIGSQFMQLYETITRFHLNSRLETVNLTSVFKILFLALTLDSLMFFCLSFHFSLDFSYVLFSSLFHPHQYIYIYIVTEMLLFKLLMIMFIKIKNIYI